MDEIIWKMDLAKYEFLVQESSSIICSIDVMKWLKLKLIEKYNPSCDSLVTLEINVTV